MRVAVGRCVKKEGSSVVNFNLKAAQLKHTDAFYDEEQKEPTENLDST